MIPPYYIGKNYGYEASKVVEDFQGDSYNIGTAITYLLRSGKKVYVNNSAFDSKLEDLQKAKAHIEFEILAMENELKHKS